VDGNVEAIFSYTIVHKNYDRDPDTVQYIKEAKERGDKYYQTYYDEYLLPQNMNFYFKAVIDENNEITLYSKNPAIENDEWIETRMSDYIIKKPEETGRQFEEATNIINEILPIYHEINTIFNGFIETKGDVIMDENGNAYMEVTDEKYKSIDDIKNLLSSVFTTEYIDERYSKTLESENPIFKEMEDRLYVAAVGGVIKPPSDNPIEKIDLLENNSFLAVLIFGENSPSGISKPTFYFKNVNGNWLIDNIEI